MWHSDIPRVPSGAFSDDCCLIWCCMATPQGLPAAVQYMRCNHRQCQCQCFWQSKKRLCFSHHQQSFRISFPCRSKWFMAAGADRLWPRITHMLALSRQQADFPCREGAAAALQFLHCVAPRLGADHITGAELEVQPLHIQTNGQGTASSSDSTRMRIERCARFTPLG